MTQDDLLRLINRRYTKARNDYADRDNHFVEYFKAIDGDIWAEDPGTNEVRVTDPLCSDTVDLDVALLVSKSPIITVPTSAVSGVDGTMASLYEQVLYGVWQACQMLIVLDKACRMASATGWGVIRGPVVVARKEFPLRITSCDPRQCYPDFDEDGRLRFNFFVTKRSVADVKADLPRQRGRLPSVWHRDLIADMEDDKEVRWMEYWGWHDDRLMHAIAVNPTVDEAVGPNDLQIGSWLKEPVDLSDDYPDIPYEYFFPRATGRAEKGREGESVIANILEVQKAKSMLMTVLASDAFNRGNQPMWTDGQILFPLDAQGKPYIDTDAGGFTQVSPGAKLDVVPGTMDHQLTSQLYEKLERMGGRSTFPAAMYGQYEGAMSGIALSLLTNPVLIRQALAQRRIEGALQNVNARILRTLARLPGSVPLFGVDKKGTPFEIDLRQVPMLGKYTHNVVQLSSSLPKDVPILGQLINSSAQQGVLSKRTAAEYLQNLMDLPNKSPEEEFEKRVAEQITEGKANIETMAALQAYQTLVAAKMQNTIPIQGAGGGAVQQGAPAGAPPYAVAPQQEPTGLAEQMGMQGQPFPGGMSGPQPQGG
jgi:hypothetical protein